MILPICCFLLVSPVASQESITWFPCNYYLPLVLREYIAEISSLDKDIVRTRYHVILSFLNDIIIAYYDNIERFFNRNKFSLRRPALIDGDLTIVEIMFDNAFSWDSNLRLYRINHAIMHPMQEAADIINTVRVKNYLINFWYTKTGELLANYINEEDHINYIRELIKLYYNEKMVPY